MNLIKKLRDKIDYHNSEIYELVRLIKVAQDICEHHYLTDPTVGRFQEKCEHCDKTRKK